MNDLVFGPVPSRRLGRSLGINNIPPKICTYSCIYCQVGRTMDMRVDREAFYKPEAILEAVEKRVQQKRSVGETVDYLTFVPDGEPTLDINLGSEIELLKRLKLPIAVISNASLISQEKVRHELRQADWVSLKFDAVGESLWRQVDRPHKRLNLHTILDGAMAFANAFRGELATETMLVADVNDGEQNLQQVGDFLAELKPDIAYLSFPTRPPAEERVHPPDEISVNQAYHLLNEKVEHVEYLTGYEGNAFASTGNVETDLLSITAVHPMRKDAVDGFLKEAGAEWRVVDQLVQEEKLVAADYGGHTFYLRRFKKRG